MLTNNHYKGSSYDYQKKICSHLDVNNIQGDVYQYFTGKGLQFNLICQNCASDLDSTKPRLVDTGNEDFEELEEYFDNIAGSPQILENLDEKLKFVHHLFCTDKILNAEIN